MTAFTDTDLAPLGYALDGSPLPLPRDADRRAAYLRDKRQSRLNELLREYIADEGVSNLCRTLETICFQECENNRCPDLETAAVAFGREAVELDMKYAHLSVQEWEEQGRS